MRPAGADVLCKGGGSRIMPGLMDQLSEQYVDVAVLTGSKQDLGKVSHHQGV